MFRKIKAVVFNLLSKTVSPFFYLLPQKHITYANDLLYTYHNADFIKDIRFAKAYNLAKEVDNGRLLSNYDIQWRIFVLCWAAGNAMKLEGDFADCGVFSGFCTRAVIDYTKFECSSKRYFLLDTFYGLDPKYSSPEEISRNNKQGYSEKDLYEEVKNTFAKFNVRIIKGAIPETLKEVDSDKFAFIHIDMNTVYPEVKALEFFWKRLVAGGMVVLDDYGYPGHLAQKKAHDEFASLNNVEILSLPTGQGLIIKPPPGID